MINVTNSGSGAYIIDGASNPTLTVIRGVTYSFGINASGHPFWLQTTAGAYDSSNTYSTGVTNGGAQVGTITWQVALDAPDTLYYVCQFHSSMNGQINVTDAQALIPAVNIQLTGRAPYIVRPCILNPPLVPEEEEPELAITTPVPPGVTYETLPVINTVTQIIDTSPDQIIGCANELPANNEQNVLGALFPGAVNGDGVVNRNNNDVWVLRAGVWENVGPTPGRQIIVTALVPPWNQTVVVVGRTRTKLETQGYPYGLLLEEKDQIISTKVRVTASRGKFTKVPSIGRVIRALLPRIVTNKILAGQAMQVVRYNGNRPASQVLHAPWPVALAIMNTDQAQYTSLGPNGTDTVPSGSLAVFDIVSGPEKFWTLYNTNLLTDTDANAIEFLEEGVRVGDNAITNQVGIPPAPYRTFLWNQPKSAWLFRAPQPPDASINTIGSVLSVGVDPQTTLDTAFPDAEADDGVIDQATGILWLYDGTVWNNEGERILSIKKFESSAITPGTTDVVEHGLGTIPEFFILKNLTRQGSAPFVGGTAIGGIYNALRLSTSAIRTYSGTVFPQITDEIIQLGNEVSTNGYSNATFFPSDFILYSFRSVPSYSKIGTYTGNGLDIGQSIDFGFQPNFVIIKCLTFEQGWVALDPGLQPSGRVAILFSFINERVEWRRFYEFEENGLRVFDFDVSQLFPNDLTTTGRLNKLGEVYVYMAFAGKLQNRFPCPSANLGLTANPPAIAKSAAISCSAINISAAALFPPYVGLRPTLIALERIRLQHQAETPSIATGVTIEPPQKTFNITAVNVSHVGQGDRGVLSYLEVVELSEGRTLESSIKGAILRFVNNLISASLWEKIETMVLMCGARTVAGAMIPLKGTYPQSSSVSDLLYDYDRIAGIKPITSGSFFSTNVTGTVLREADNHMAAYVVENVSGTYNYALMGNSPTATGGMAIARSASENSFKSRNKNSSTNTTAAPYWTGPSLVGMSRGNSSEYTVRVGNESRTVTAGTVTPSFDASRVINMFYDGGTVASGLFVNSNYRVPIYSFGRDIDLALLEEKIEIFLTELAEAFTNDGLLNVPTATLTLEGRAPSRLRFARVNVPSKNIQISTVIPLAVGREGVVVTATASEIQFVLPVPGVSTGVSVPVGARSVSIQSYAPVAGPPTPAVLNMPAKNYVLSAPSGVTISAEAAAAVQLIIPVTIQSPEPAETYSCPINAQWVSQIIVATYSGAEMSLACGGASSASIEGMKIFIEEAPSTASQPFLGYKIGAKNTTNNVIDDNSGDYGGTFTQVYGPVNETFTTEGVYKDFVFTTPILWTGGNFVFSWVWCYTWPYSETGKSPLGAGVSFIGIDEDYIPASCPFAINSPAPYEWTERPTFGLIYTA